MLVVIVLLLGIKQGKVSAAAAAAGAGGGTETAAAAGRNVWLERREFYNSAIPRDSEEEEKMLQAALELSKLEHRKSSLHQNLSLVLSLHCK